ncbi:hypothetical protein [Rhizobium sp. A37_96]
MTGVIDWFGRKYVLSLRRDKCRKMLLTVARGDTIPDDGVASWIAARSGMWRDGYNNQVQGLVLRRRRYGPVRCADHPVPMTRFTAYDTIHPQMMIDAICRFSSVADPASIPSQKHPVGERFV